MTNKKFKMAAMSLVTLVCLLRRNTLRPRRQKLP